MDTANMLEKQLMALHRKSYPAYKSLQGSYRFPKFFLHIDHVQGDPFAAPSKVSVEIETKAAGFDGALFDTDYKRIALQDFLLREFGRTLNGYTFQAQGSGKSGVMSVSRCGQEVLNRTALEINEKRILVRFEVGFPANGRTINAVELKKILFDFVPQAVEKSLYYKNLNVDKIKRTVCLAEDQYAIRQELKKRELAAFVANGSILPRESGVSHRPMKDAVAFQSPKSMEVELTLPHKGKLTGMGIPRGITLIVGGGYHGKSTLLKALELGVYNHIAGDGREYVITDDTAMKIRAEDGRSIFDVNVSSFINHLPNKKDTIHFFTEDASGSTSQAANVVEAIEADSKVLLIDEDTSATNFMVRDELMQSVIAREKEPITPFIERARELYEQKGVSVIMVAGSSGAYFYIADTVLQMDNYRTLDITEKVRGILKKYEKSTDASDTAGTGETANISETVNADKTVNTKELTNTREKEGVQKAISGIMGAAEKRYVKTGNIEKKHGQIKIKQYGKDSFSIGRETVDLNYVEQLADSEQTTTLSYVLKAVLEQAEKEGKTDLRKAAEDICQFLEKKGMAALCKGSYLPVSMAEVRKQEVYACLNRYRGYRKNIP